MTVHASPARELIALPIYRSGVHAFYGTALARYYSALLTENYYCAAKYAGIYFDKNASREYIYSDAYMREKWLLDTQSAMPNRERCETGRRNEIGYR